MFKNPVLGVPAGALLTAVIQSSSASVGILQALAVTIRCYGNLSELSPDRPLFQQTVVIRMRFDT